MAATDEAVAASVSAAATRPAMICRTRMIRCRRMANSSDPRARETASGGMLGCMGAGVNYF
jgi:hypothetical protein